MTESFGGYVADHAFALETLDPGAPLDDLEPLVETFAGARVVALGESAHRVREFALLRHRLLRFLVERCGFSAFGMESGFTEGRAIDAWIRGGPGSLQQLADDHVTYQMGRSAEVRAQLAWQREAGVRFYGLDVPGSAASPLPALENVGHYLRQTDVGALPTVDRLIAQVAKYASEQTLVAYGAYAALDPADRDEVTALLAELTTRLEVLEHNTEGHRVARHELRLASLLDQDFRSYAALLDGDSERARVAARDRGMAETVLWLLAEDPDRKIVLGAHNSHIQRKPVITPEFSLPVAGHHLARRLRDSYVAVALTAIAGRTTTRRPDPNSPSGVLVTSAELDAPVAGSVEAAVPGLHAVDLRGAREHIEGPSRIRLMDTYLDVDVVDAYDVVVTVPSATTTLP